LKLQLDFSNWQLFYWLLAGLQMSNGLVLVLWAAVFAIEVARSVIGPMACGLRPGQNILDSSAVPALVPGLASCCRRDCWRNKSSASQPSGWQGFSLLEAAQGWASYLAYGLPCVAMVCLEWWVWEVRCWRYFHVVVVSFGGLE
jgi:hypothetical protein